MDEKELPPHVLIFPLPLQGPVNSMFNLAELLCLSGLHITVVVTEDIHGRLLRSTDIQARFASYQGFQLKTIPDGLPEDHPRNGDKFIELIDSLRSKTKPRFKDMLTSAGCLSSESCRRRPVSFIIADGILGFTCDVAREIGIPIVYVRTLSPCCLWVFCCLPRLFEAGELPFAGDDLNTLIKSVPGTETFLRRRDLPEFCRSGDLADKSIQLFKTECQEISRADGLILNTFEELDGIALSHIQKICPNLYTIGPLHAHLKTKKCKETTMSPTYPSTSSSLLKEDMSCLAWLDEQPSKSVIYVSFGSIAALTEEQLMEFWNGLVNSGSRFLWVIKLDTTIGRSNKIPDEVAEGTRQRGCMVDWAPQEKVLEHAAIGGFLTHSGWNSSLESIYAGVPMICWPFFLDQQVNSRFVSEVWKVGVDMKDVSCDRVVVEKMVRELMAVKKEEFLKRADEMAKLARVCLGEGGSSFSNLQRLVRDIYSFTTAS